MTFRSPFGLLDFPLRGCIILSDRLIGLGVVMGSKQEEL
jgi:hypothetical protein